jgi:hypothetical protein
MAPDEWKAFTGFVRCARRYVEFGAGASTVLAAALVADRVVAFDSSQNWLAQVAEACRARETRITPTLCHIDIGETGEWGFPKDATKRDRWPLYYTSMWDDGRLAEADLYLVDGRFRLACFAQVLLHCADHAFIAFHDYASRPHYHRAASLAREVLRVDNLSIFMRAPGFDRELALGLVADHAHDPR